MFFFTLSKTGTSFEKWKEKLKTNMLTQKFKEYLSKKTPPPTEQEIDRFYAENKAQFSLKPLIFLRQIVLKEKFKADILRKRLNQNNFKEMAENFSVTPEKAKQGALGWIQKGSVPLFDRAFKLRVGKISKVIASPYGYHIFLVEKKENEKKALLKQIKKKVAANLMEQKKKKYFQKWLKNKIQNIKIYKDIRLIQSIEVSVKK